jgi:hypothetical protein
MNRIVYVCLLVYAPTETHHHLHEVSYELRTL